ncbi:GPALPP motifs-containing protein 1 [Pristis pectinata]|uniref:GPALPP motifs-containing protein 1 n=1 Tax=Pristis pectinata TaxID=685728 RepID=UPI00223D7A25|nr:GPALPP motifs-containing protein 1 [Pristis pectinata]
MSEERAPLIGPALPPGYRARGQRSQPDSDRRRRPRAALDETVAGPALPPGFRSSKSSESSDDDEVVYCTNERKQSSAQELGKSDRIAMEESNGTSRARCKQLAAPQIEDDGDDGFFGPALPPGFPKREQSPERPFIGPALPPGFSRSEKETELAVPSSLSMLPPDEDSDEETLIGPMPSTGTVENSVVADIERRSNRMKEKLVSGDMDDSQKQARESWMTELPPVLQNIGLGARTFKRRANGESSDRSIWTDTPADRERKAQEMLEAKVSSAKDSEQPNISERDKRLAKEVASYNESTRSESLLDMHSKKLKRKAEAEKSKPQERRAFDRDQDLQVHRFDEAQKKALIKKSKELNSRFSHGKSNMFL